MRILAVSSWWPEPADNGARLRISNLLRVLAQRHEVHLVALAQATVTTVQQTRAREYCTSAGAVQQRAWAPRRGEQLASLWRPEPASVRATYNPHFAELVQRRADAVRPDVVVAMQIQAAPYAAVVPGVPRIFEELELARFRDSFQHERDPRRRARNWLTLWKQQSYIRRLLRDFDACTVVSEAERGIVGPIAPAGMPIAVVPNGTDVAAAARFVAAGPTALAGRPEPEPDTLVYPGALSYDANYDAVSYFLAEVFPIIRAAKPHVRIRITGNSEPAQRAALDGPGVEWTGWVPDVRPVIVGSWCEVVPLRIGSGTRLKVLEALALGTPVISTSKGVEGLELEHGRDVLVADTAEAFAAETLRVLDDRALRSRLALAGRAAVAANYDWSAIGATLEQLIADTYMKKVAA